MYVGTAQGGLARSVESAWVSNLQQKIYSRDRPTGISPVFVDASRIHRKRTPETDTPSVFASFLFYEGDDLQSIVY